MLIANVKAIEVYSKEITDSFPDYEEDFWYIGTEDGHEIMVSGWSQESEVQNLTLHDKVSMNCTNVKLDSWYPEELTVEIRQGETCMVFQSEETEVVIYV